MKAIGIIGSRRKEGNSFALVKSVLEPLAGAGAETEIIFLGDYEIGACTGCEGCAKSYDCVISDGYQAVVEAIDGAGAVVLASPTYWYSVTSDMKRFIDRSYSLIQYPRNRQEWIGKYGGSGKRCVTVAVCEQSEEEMMGNTSDLLSSFAADVGLAVVASVKALGFFEAGSVAYYPATLDSAREAGRKLLGTGA
ncbi:MAG: flavodoxin family protein [Spirochaetaceae bacterium]